MGIFDRFKKKSAKPAESKEKPAKTKSPKEIATELGEPYVDIIGIDVNPDNINEGSVELDWNDKFVANLIRAGYQMNPNDTDVDIVERWWVNVCRHQVMETYEQEQAINPSRFTKSRDIGDGRTEVS